jgi:solute carrier family 10 (sodium/bile acid cotransporter), member 7
MDLMRARLIDVVGGDNLDEFEMKGSAMAKKASGFAKAQCLPLGLMAGLLLSISVPFLGAFLDQSGLLSYVCIVLIFLISGLKLQTAEWNEAMRAYKAILFSLTSILFLTPIIGFGLTSLISWEPQEFNLGLCIFFCSPCAINSSVVLTKQVPPPPSRADGSVLTIISTPQAGGNAALSLLLTVSASILASFTTPLMLSAALNLEGIELPVADMVLKLAGTILLPLLGGKTQPRSKFLDQKLHRHRLLFRSKTITDDQRQRMRPERACVCACVRCGWI